QLQPIAAGDARRRHGGSWDPATPARSARDHAVARPGFAGLDAAGADGERADWWNGDAARGLGSDGLRRGPVECGHNQWAPRGRSHHGAIGAAGTAKAELNRGVLSV